LFFILDYFAADNPSEYSAAENACRGLNLIPGNGPVDVADDGNVVKGFNNVEKIPEGKRIKS